MSRSFRAFPALILLGIVTTVGGACRAKPTPEEPKQPEQSEQPEEYVSGCVSNEHTFRELLEACTHDYGTTFVLEDGVERDLAKMSFTQISCFIPPGTKASDITLSAPIEMVQHMLLRCRKMEDLDLMIDREALPGTNTYRIYRLPRGAQSPWDSGADGR